MKAIHGKMEMHSHRLEVAVGAVLLVTLVVSCAASPLLTVVALLALLCSALIGPGRALVALLVVAIPLFPSLRDFASLATVRCDEFLLVALAAIWAAQLFTRPRIVIVGKEIMLLQFAAIVWGVAGFAWLALTGRTEGRVGELFVVYRRVQILLLFFLVVQQVDTLKKAKQMLVLTVLISAIVSIIGLLQFADVGPVRGLIKSFYTIPGTTLTHPDVNRVTSTFDSHPNALGAYYVIVLSILTAWVASSPRKFLNPVWLGVLVLGYATVVASASRASLFALIIGVVVISVMRRIRLLFVMIAPMTLALYFAGGHMAERLVELYNALVHGRIPMHRSLGMHFRHWALALDKMTNMPFVGYGFAGDRAFAINRYLDNYYLYLIYHEGYVSVLLFLGLLAMSLLALYRIATRCKDEFVRSSGLGLLAGMVGLAAHAIGADTFTWERVGMVLWLCLALVIRADSLVEDDVVADSSRAVGPRAVELSETMPASAEGA